MKISLSPEECLLFFIESAGVTAGMLLICLLLGGFIALARFWQTPGFRYLAEFWLRRPLAVLRRIPPVGILIVSRIISFIRGAGGRGYPFSGSMPWLAPFFVAACFLPEVSDALLAGMQKAPGTQRGGVFLRRTLSDALPDLLGTLGELWKLSYIYVYIYPFQGEAFWNIYQSQYELKNLLILGAVYWLLSLLTDTLFFRLRRRLMTEPVQPKAE